MQGNGPCSERAATDTGNRGVSSHVVLVVRLVVTIQPQHPYRDGRWARTAGMTGTRDSEEPCTRGVAVLLSMSFWTAFKLAALC